MRKIFLNLLAVEINSCFKAAWELQMGFLKDLANMWAYYQLEALDNLFVATMLLQNGCFNSHAPLESNYSTATEFREICEKFYTYNGTRYCIIKLT
jgi:hypothetical protein